MYLVCFLLRSNTFHLLIHLSAGIPNFLVINAFYSCKEYISGNTELLEETCVRKYKYIGYGV
uniref:Uncharacterized protein n=1 Tax=Onchocerca volvulus TaxID=6282 RepID=A0A8R1XYS4_ONCVO